MLGREENVELLSVPRHAINRYISDFGWLIFRHMKGQVTTLGLAEDFHLHDWQRP